jgi:hypothetical protein
MMLVMMPERSASSIQHLPASHTSGEQWLSFELRMRRRRAERCLLRAHAALRAGLVEDARRALAEAKEMEPAMPAAAALEAGIAALPRRRRYVGLASAAASITLLALTAFAVWPAWRPSPEPQRHMGAHADVLLPPAAIASAAPPASESPVEQPDPAPSAGHAAALPQPRRLEPIAGSPALPNSTALEPEAAPRPVPELSPLPAFETSLPAPALPAAPIAGSAAGGLDPPASPDADSAAIRRVLARYEAAYSDLDAAAARAVWPAVDERALARAFDGLAMQRVSLDDCDVLVTGVTARATCAGTAAWTARVGGGRGTQARRWAFELRNADGAWQIVRADTR